MGGRGANSGLPISNPSGGGGGSNNGKKDPMDMNPGQPKTLAEALGQKGRPMSTHNAVSKANPFYDKSASTAEYNENCQRAVIATEARFRGYDVIAQPTYDGDKMPNHNSWAKNFVGAKIETVGKSTPNATQKAIEQKMQQYGDGARAIMSVQWKGGRGDGHVINVVQRGKNTYYYDGQNGTVVNAVSLYRGIRTKETSIARVDNLAFSDTAREAVRTTPKNRRK